MFNGKDAIITAITANAAATAKNLINDGKEAADEKKREADERLAAIEAELNAKAEGESALNYERQVTLAKLDCSRVLLSAKQEIITDVYARVKQKILALDPKKYAEFYLKKVAAAAEDGDKVCVCAEDKSVLNADWLKKVESVSKKKLTLDKESAPSRGVILKNAAYDKDLTIDALIDALKQDTQADVIKELFD